jgi:signal transduction histidine kinase/ActR/RegA family two-component response regulator
MMPPMLPSRVLSAFPGAAYAFDRELRLVYSHPYPSKGEQPPAPELDGLQEALQTGQSQRRERWVGAPGSQRVWEYCFSPLRDDGGVSDLIVVMVTDITERRLAQVRIAQLQSIAMRLSALVSPEEIGELVIRHILQDLGAAAVVAYLESEGAMRLVAWEGISDEMAQARAVLTAGTPVPLMDALRTGEPLWMESREELLERYPNLASSPTPAALVQAVAALPATFERRTLGGIGLSFAGSRKFDPATREFLMAIATLYAQAAERTRLLQVEERARQRLIVLAEASRAFSSARLDLRAVLDTVCREVSRRLSESCAVHLLSPEGGLELVGFHHLDPLAEASSRAALAARPVRVGDPSTPGRVAATGQGVLVERIPLAALLASTEPEYRAHLERFPIQSLIVVPLRSQGHVMGTMTTARGDGHPPFDAHDFELMQELADRAALSIENARLYSEANAARERSDAASRAKDEFLALLGHELRNPLAPILGWLRMLRTQPENLDQTISIIERQTRHMARLVDDLLDVSRITSRRLQLQVRPIELRPVLEQATDLVRPLLEGLAQLRLDVPSGLQLVGDPDRLAQVFANLLGNALKFGGPGAPVEVRARRQGEWLEVTVRDWGAGIEAEELPLIFEAFTQGRQGGRRPGGLGLGLAIVRDFVAMHGGTVTAHSDGPGTGSTFRVQLPAGAPAQAPLIQPEPAAERQAEAEPPERASPLRILVVEDNRDAADALTALLRFEGCSVETCYDASTALRVGAAFQPEVALLDLDLPDMHGYELGNRLRALPGLAGLDLVAITGYGQSADRSRSRQAGFREHLVKPIEFDGMMSLLARLWPARVDSLQAERTPG